MFLKNKQKTSPPPEKKRKKKNKLGIEYWFLRKVGGFKLF